ncbi:MAG: ribosome-binding factor A [Epulopiscium sp. Nuni2H_MBin003]|nr:MAG: ribosome-binding factor A [Epulopiscium sp. Nuni2H_MBin003]
MRVTNDKMANQRIMRVNEEIRREISEIIREGIKDQRIKNTMISITAVETTTDLKMAKVFISVLQDEKKEEVLDAITESSLSAALERKRANQSAASASSA